MKNGMKSPREILFWEVIDELMFEDLPTVCSYFVQTAQVKNWYASHRMMDMYPTISEFRNWFSEAGYIYLGLIHTRAKTEHGSFWTDRPDLFIFDGKVNQAEVSRCVYRRMLYLKVKDRICRSADYSVGDVVRLFGVSANTIREWDVKKILPAIRTEGGHRRYNLVDLVNFED